MTSAEIAATFNASSSAFARVAPLVWGPAGQALTFQLRLRPGDAVLDVCSGTGASALPAATAVGPTGFVHAIDLADDLLEEGRLIASERALLNIDFVQADATEWEPPSSVPSAGYDAVASSYGVFFLPHMDTSVARLVRLVRPGGRIGVTVWREGALDGYANTYFEVLGRYLTETTPQEQDRAFESVMHASERLQTVELLSTWLESFGTTSVEVNELSNLLPATEEFAWDFVLGSRLRAPLAALGEATVDTVRAEFIDLLTDRGVHTIDAGTLVGTAVVHR